jgi:hypothetical protein
VYDMYPWDIRPPAPRNGADPAAQDPVTQDPANQDPATQDRATRAVQVALDRRDNGGGADQ